MKWTTLQDKVQVDLQAEKEASARRALARKIAGSGSKENPQFAGLHMAHPRVSLGAGGFVVSVKRGRSWL